MEAIVAFLKEVEGLKSTLRRAKTRTGRIESTAEHSWRLALMVVLVGEEVNKTLSSQLDLLTALKIALIHDISETYMTQDIDPADVARGVISQAEKTDLEQASIRKILAFLPTLIANEYETLWQDYEHGRTPEALFVKSLDKLETTLQHSESTYEGWLHHPEAVDFSGAYGNANFARTPYLAELVTLIKAELRQRFESFGSVWKNDYNLNLSK
jgi:putative hydrolase of HD superfamily